MNYNNIKRLNKVLKSMIEDFEETSTMKELKRRLSEKEEELKQAKEEGDNDSVDIINEIIEELNEEIEEEKLNPTEEQHFKSRKVVRRQLIEKLIKEHKQKNEDYKNTFKLWRENYELWIEFGCEYHRNKHEIYREELNYFEEDFKFRANLTVEDMEENNQFEQYYLIHSGKLEYQQKVDKINAIKEAQTKLNDVIADYTTKQSTLTTDDFETFVLLWNEFINEPLTIDLTPIVAKYNGKIIEIYKFNVADSVHKDRIQCSDMNDKPIDKQNVYVKYTGQQIEKPVETKHEDVKPIDVITYKNETYEVYNTNVEGSEFYKRVKTHSTTTNKTRDFKNKYLKKLE